MTHPHLHWNLLLIGILTFGGCASIPAPKVVPGKGAIYGIVAADSHKVIRDKAAGDSTSIYSEGGKVVYSDKMVNYAKLKELYVCLIGPGNSGGREHSLVAQDKNMSKRSVALAPGDKLRIRNSTSKTQNFFIAETSGNEEGFQAFPPLSAGTEAVFTIKLEGDLELASEESDQLVTALLSRPGLVSQMHSSGSPYAFERLEPGAYNVIFWFWRLGYTQHRVGVQAGQNSHLDETLSVDRIIR